MKAPDSISPPGWPLRLLRIFLRKEYLEEIEGDMEEHYREHLKQYSKRKADRRYALDVLRLFRPGLITLFPGIQNLNTFDMYRNYFKIALRNLVKDRMYSIIKIGGFAIGIAACLSIALYVRDELSYDKHYEHGDQIYRLIQVENNPSEPQVYKWTAFPAEAAHVLQDEFPEVELAGRLIPYDWYDAGANQVRRSDRTDNHYEEGFAYADQSLLEILEIPMVYGKRAEALAQPNTIVLSRSMAEKYFPHDNPVGKTLILNENAEKPFTIGGVMQDFPSNHHLQFDFLITLTGVEFWDGEQTNWCCSNYNPYVRLRPGTDPRALEQKLLSMRDNYIVAHLRKNNNQYADDAAKYRSFYLQPVGDIHLHSTDIGDFMGRSDYRIVWLFSAIALFILLLACINFINLSTAKSANRAKEVGIRKVSGSYRSNLIQQFMVESLFFSAVSVTLGLLIARALLPWFNQLSGKSLAFPVGEWWFVPMLMALTLVIGLLAGLYPSFYLSSFRPVEVLKGSISRGSKSSRLRGGMVVFQFTTCFVLIVAAWIVYRQMHFILNKKLGYDKEQVVMIQGANTLGDQLDPFKEELLRQPGIEYVTTSNYYPVMGTKRDQNEFWKAGRSEIDKGIGSQFWWVDEDYLAAMGMRLKEGRNFSREMASDTAALIINETFAHELGLDDPLDKEVQNWRKWRIIGVVDDFHWESMKTGIRPVVMALGKGGSIMSVKVNTADMPGLLGSIEQAWHAFMPHQTFRYTFMDETYAHVYADVQRTGNVFATCALLSILIACLGLFGLSTFMAEQRSKEISIRKVLGASVANLFRLLTFNFLKLVVISLLIGIPLAWYLMRKWLEDYEYRIGIGWWVFAVSGMAVVSIALFTVGRQALKVSFSNPVDYLKDE